MISPESMESHEGPLQESCTTCAQQLSDARHTVDGCRCPGTYIHSTEDEKIMNNSSNEMLPINDWHNSFHDQDYIEKINQFQIYVDEVKRITRPGCPPEMVNVALSSMSSLCKTLSTMMISSERWYMHASL